ncbi:hypothetical protein GRJ2_002451600 [Grus japonensis]|uniref:Uncharacterized protein n=1 Tax=Grus japonensis TaxID=30415 RepID=A0ABC9XR03_GRUJA
MASGRGGARVGRGGGQGRLRGADGRGGGAERGARRNRRILCPEEVLVSVKESKTSSETRGRCSGILKSLPLM